MKTPKIVAVLILLALVAGSASAFENSLPEPLEKGSFIISPMFAFGFYDPLFGSFSNNSIMLGGDVAVDWVLPINFPLAIGLEAGFHGAKVDVTGSDSSVSVIPIAARVAWHPNFGISGLDVYLLAKVGWAIGFFGGDAADTWENPGGLVYGGDIGVRYFFTDLIGVVLEGGYNYYVLVYKGKNGGSWAGFATNYVSAGISFKL